MLDTYLAGTGVFTANAFIKHMREYAQCLRFYGVNAHHQNRITERADKRVPEAARVMMLHASIRWKDGIDVSLWPMSTTYFTHICNHMSNTNWTSPVDLLTGNQSSRHKLKYVHT